MRNAQYTSMSANPPALVRHPSARDQIFRLYLARIDTPIFQLHARIFSAIIHNVPRIGQWKPPPIPNSRSRRIRIMIVNKSCHDKRYSQQRNARQNYHRYPRKLHQSPLDLDVESIVPIPVFVRNIISRCRFWMDNSPPHKSRIAIVILDDKHVISIIPVVNGIEVSDPF